MQGLRWHSKPLCQGLSEPQLTSIKRHQQPNAKTQTEGGDSLQLCELTGGLTPNRYSSWKQENSQPQLTINVTAWVDADDDTYFEQSPTPITYRVIAVADTGCQISLMSVWLLHHLGVKRSKLIPTRMHMKPIKRKSVNILGAILLHMLGQDVYSTFKF